MNAPAPASARAAAAALVAATVGKKPGSRARIRGIEASSDYIVARNQRDTEQKAADDARIADLKAKLVKLGENRVTTKARTDKKMAALKAAADKEYAAFDSEHSEIVAEIVALGVKPWVLFKETRAEVKKAVNNEPAKVKAPTTSKHRTAWYVLASIVTLIIALVVGRLAQLAGMGFFQNTVFGWIIGLLFFALVISAGVDYLKHHWKRDNLPDPTL